MPKKSIPAAEQPAAPLPEFPAGHVPEVVDSPEALAFLADKAAAETQALAIRATYAEDEISALTRYGFHLEDVPALVETRLLYEDWMRAGTEGLLALGAHLAGIKEQMPWGGWQNYLDWIGLPYQSANRAIDAAAAAQQYPQLPARAGLIDQSAMSDLGQSRARLTPEAVDVITDRADATGRVTRSDIRIALDAWGLPAKERSRPAKDPDLGLRRADPAWAALNMDTLTEAAAGWIGEAQDDAHGLQAGLVRQTPGFRAFLKQITGHAPATTEFVETIRRLLPVAYYWAVSADAGGLLTPYTPTPVEAGVYDTTPRPEWTTPPTYEDATPDASYAAWEAEVDAATPLEEETVLAGDVVEYESEA